MNIVINIKEMIGFGNDEMLDLILKLGILKQIGTEKYTFVDEKYYNFFYYSAGELLNL